LIKLQDNIRIQTTPEQLFQWLESMPQEYVSWHPDHVACRVIQGSMLRSGAEIECQEYLHGKLHTMQFRLTRVDPGRRIEYEIEALGKGAFEAIPKGEDVEFVAELGLGTETPLVGRIVDTVLCVLFARQLKAMRQHMREEGQNLKKIIESGWKLKSSVEATI
jgi:hypothetical protein